MQLIPGGMYRVLVDLHNDVFDMPILREGDIVKCMSVRRDSVDLKPMLSQESVANYDDVVTVDLIGTCSTEALIKLLLEPL